MPARVPHQDIDDLEHKRCCRCKNWKQLDYFSKNPRAWDNLLARCKDCDCERVKNSLKKPKNKKRRQLYDSEYNSSKAGRNRWKRYRESKNGKEKRRQYKRKWRNENKHKLEWKLRQYMSSRAWEIYFKSKKTKNISTIEMFGCGLLKLRCHMESRFEEYMTPENHGKKGWHIDHVVPCTAWDLNSPVEQRVCFWYKNLQPMWASDNIKKSDKYKEEVKQKLIKDWVFYNI
jgi:hypothetical protein